jgi:hypothetical protein
VAQRDSTSPALPNVPSPIPGRSQEVVGVIARLVNVEALLQKIGISSVAITSGPFKASGNLTPSLRPEERQAFQTLVGDAYQQCADAVAEGCNLPTPLVLTSCRWPDLHGTTSEGAESGR